MRLRSLLLGRGGLAGRILLGSGLVRDRISLCRRSAPIVIKRRDRV